MKFNTRYKFMELKNLKQHEQINNEHYNKLAEEIKTNQYVVPIIVDCNSYVILDGHHRYNIMKDLGFNNIPVFLVDYRDPNIKVSSWREDVKVTKQEVVWRGLNGFLYPAKTSRHLVNIEEKRIILDEVRK